MYYQFIYFLTTLIPYQSEGFCDRYAMNFHRAMESQFDYVTQPFLWAAKIRQRNTSSTLGRDWWLEHMLHWKHPMGLSERIPNQIELIRGWILILDFISDLSVFTSDFTYPLFALVEPVQVRSIHMKWPFQHKYREYSQRYWSLI